MGIRSALGTRLGFEFRERFQEPLTTFRGVEDDVVVLELRLQLLEVRDRERPAGTLAFGCEKTVAARFSSARHRG